MKKIYLFLFFMFIYSTLQAQNRFGLEVGEGWSSLKSGLYSGIRYQFSTTPEITVGLNYLRRINNNMYIGARLFFNQYMFSYTMDLDSTVHRNGGEIDTKSSYFFIAPTFDIGIDHRQILHAYISGAYGLLLHGTQRSHTYSYLYNGTFTDNSYASDMEINHRVTRIDIGLVQHIRLSPDWHFTINESYSFMQGQLTAIDNTINNSITLSPKYINVQIGVMYKFIYTGWAARYDEED